MVPCGTTWVENYTPLRFEPKSVQNRSGVQILHTALYWNLCEVPNDLNPVMYDSLSTWVTACIYIFAEELYITNEQN